MKTKIEDYGLLYYVQNLYSTNAGRRGGEAYKPLYKKDLKPFIIAVKYVINTSKKVLNKTLDKYPIINN